MPSQRRRRAQSSRVVNLDKYRRARYLAQTEPTDVFLRDAQILGRILAAAVRLPEIRAGDLYALLARMRVSLDHYDGADPLAQMLREQARRLWSEIDAR